MPREEIDWSKSFNEKFSTNSSETSTTNRCKSLKDILGNRVYKPKRSTTDKTTKYLRILPPALNEQIGRLKVTFHEVKDPHEPKKFVHIICNNYSHDYKDMNTCEVCKRYFKAKKENDTYTLSSMKLVTRYYYNVLVLEDPEEPENEGKVFFLDTPKFIDDKIFSFLNPQETNGRKKTKEDVSSYKFGRDLEYVITLKSVPINDQKVILPNYDQSVFLDKSPITFKGNELNDSELDLLDTKIHSLQSILASENLPTKEQIESALKYIYGDFSSEEPQDIPKEEPKKSYIESSKVSAPKASKTVEESLPSFSESEEDTNFDSFLNDIN